MSFRDNSVLDSADLLSTLYCGPNGVGGGGDALGVATGLVETEEDAGFGVSEPPQPGSPTAQVTAAKAATRNFKANSSIDWASATLPSVTDTITGLERAHELAADRSSTGSLAAL